MPSGGQPLTAEPRPRLTERHVLALGLGASGLFVLAAALTAVATMAGRGSSWAALHLALAGAATVAIGAFMPHFAITLAGTRASASPQRLASLVALALGSVAVVLGVSLNGRPWVAAGTASVVTGLSLVACTASRRCASRWRVDIRSSRWPTEWPWPSLRRASSWADSPRPEFRQ